MRKADLTVTDQAVTRAGFKSGNLPQKAREGGGTLCEFIARSSRFCLHNLLREYIFSKKAILIQFLRINFVESVPHFAI
jgi:hypothetical protein